MKISDIIRSILDLIDREEHPAEKPAEIAVEPGSDGLDLEYLVKLAGLQQSDDSEPVYSNEPNPQVRTISAVLASGDDVNKSKHPSDIRSNASSMFPDFQARNN